MIINNEHVRGIFLYSDGLEFEEGDFVISDSVIYNCHPVGSDTVSGKDPKNDKVNFTPYPGKQASYQDYANYVSSDRSALDFPDYYVSSSALYEVIQGTFFGLSSGGIITEDIEDLVGKVNPLDELIKSETYNNGMVKVDRRKAAEVLPDIYVSNNIYYALSELERSVIIRQYSCKMVDEVYRIQELIDFYSKSMFCRTYKIGGDVVGPWESMIETDATLLAKYKRVKTWYEDEITHLDHQEYEFGFIKMRDGFHVTGSGSTNALDNPSINSIYANHDELLSLYPESEYDGNQFEVTFVIAKAGGVKEVYSVTINIFLNNTYYFNSNNTLVVTVNPIVEENVSNTTLTLPTGYYFKDAYCRYYKSMEKGIEHNINITPSPNGTVESVKNIYEAKGGDTVRLIITSAEGYKLSSVTVKDIYDNDVAVDPNAYTFTMPSDSNVTISSEFELINPPEENQGEQENNG